jgi:T4-like virus tail tube protein gp19
MLRIDDRCDEHAAIPFPDSLLERPCCGWRGSRSTAAPKFGASFDSQLLDSGIGHGGLERGLDPSDKLWAWRQQVVDGKVADARKNGAVSVMGPDGSRLLRWEFINGWPCGWLVSTEDGSEIALEQVEIAHEGLRLVR